MLEATFTTPGGHAARMHYRDGTSDWNTIAACLRNPMAVGEETGDEYRIPSGISGWALDVGAHIGSVTVGLLLDNPNLRVLAIEAVPDNAELVRTNVEANGLTDRATVLNAAAWDGEGSIAVEYGYTGSEVAEVHTWIGSVTPWLARPKDTTVKSAVIPIVTLGTALRYTNGAGFEWVKTDCEGCEHRFFIGSGLRKLKHIVGEWHTRDGSPESFAERLSKTHDVTWQKGIGGGPFEARLR